MKVLVSGSRGFIGSALVPFLERRRHEVWRLLRSEEQASREPRALFWDPSGGRLDGSALEGFDAVIHLCGANLSARRWNEAFKREIYESRVGSTRLLARALAALKKKPAVFLHASAVGIYGNRGEEELSEESAPGQDFLARLCLDWEAAAQEAAGLRVCHLRFGVALARQGGALAKMLPLFRFGLGGRLGSGKQQISWIALPDLLSAVTFLLESPSSQGAYNLCSPHPVSNLNFTKALARTVGMPALLPLPAFAARLALGEMADLLLLASQKALPERLKSEGFKFELPYLGEALTRLVVMK